MANDTFDYARLLNDIDAKMASLQTLRASVLVASASGALGQPIEGAELPSQTLTAGRNDSLGVPTDLPEGAFNGKSVPACIELYLSSAPMKKKTNKEIATALREGGVESNASKFDTIIAGALFKLKKDGKILRFKDGWGLSSWYPPHIRGAIDAGSGKRTKKKGKRGDRKPKLNTPSPSELSPAKGKANIRALELLRSKPGVEYFLADVGTHLGMGIKGARLILGKLIKEGKVEKTPQERYRAARPQLVAASV
jgi:hypothetical protein